MAQIRLLHSKPTTCSSYPSLLHLRPQGTAPFVNCIVPHRLSTTTCSRSSPSSFPRTRGDLGPNWSLNCFCHHRGHLPLLLPCCSLDFTPTIQGPHGKGTGIFHLTRSPQIYKKPYNKCFFWRHLLRPRQLDLLFAILIRVSAVPWTPRPLQRVVVFLVQLLSSQHLCFRLGSVLCIAAWRLPLSARATASRRAAVPFIFPTHPPLENSSRLWRLSGIHAT